MFPKIGQMLYITFDTLNMEEQKLQYKSRITDIHNETIEIEIPIEVESGVYTVLEPGKKLKVCFLTNDSVKNFFYSEVVQPGEESIEQLLIEKPAAESITRNQRRKYLRVPANLEIAVKLSEEMRFLTKTKDLSGGGASFVCSAKFPLHAGQKLSGWLLLSSKREPIEHISFEAEIVRVKMMAADDSSTEEAEEKQLGMIKFVSISEIDQEKLIRFCFERQLEYRK